MDLTTVSDILTATTRDGGVTVNGTGIVRPTRGFAVGTQRGTFRKLGWYTDLTSFHIALSDAMAVDGTGHAGTWLQGTTIHVDPVRIVGDLDIALAIARITEQETIFDFARGEAITVL